MLALADPIFETILFPNNHLKFMLLIKAGVISDGTGNETHGIAKLIPLLAARNIGHYLGGDSDEICLLTRKR